MIFDGSDIITEDQFEALREEEASSIDDPEKMGMFLSRFGWALRVECSSRSEMLRAAEAIRDLGYEVREYAK